MSKTRKRVLSALAILFAVALVFTACLALTGCGETEDDGDTKKDETTETTTTVTGTKLTLAAPEGSTLNEAYTAGSWVYQYDATYDPSDMATGMGRTSTEAYAFVFETGQILFGYESDYETLIVNGAGMGTNGEWEYTNGAFTFNFGDSTSNTATVVDNKDGSATLTAVSGNFGTYVATVNVNEIASAIAA